jgi:DNA ligase (NAD+)
VTVSRATLHNAAEIARKRIAVGDSVRVIRAGDVIPEVVGRVSPPVERPRFFRPERCPACGGMVARDGPVDRCPNGLACRPQLRGAIQHFASRGALDIPGLGPRTVERLIQAGLLRSVADIFTLTTKDLQGVERMAEVSARNLVGAISAARSPELSRFLLALGIPEIGARRARILAERLGTWNTLSSASESRLARIPGVGRHAAHVLWTFLRQPANRRTIELCLRRGLRPRPTVPTRGALAGETVVFTGRLGCSSRVDAEALAIQHGARVVSGVGPSVTMVVVGRDPGAKYRRARGLGIKVLSEAEWLSRLRQRPLRRGTGSGQSSRAHDSPGPRIRARSARNTRGGSGVGARGRVGTKVATGSN